MQARLRSYLTDLLASTSVGLQFCQDGLGLLQDSIHLVPDGRLGFCGLSICSTPHPERKGGKVQKLGSKGVAIERSTWKGGGWLAGQGWEGARALF